jgi:hypothetical protein
MGFEELFPWDAVWEFRTNDASHGAQQLICVTCKVHSEMISGDLGGLFGKRFKET